MFEHGALCLTPIGDSDEVDIRLVDTGGLTSERPAIFLDLLGMIVEDAWEMTNHRGYRDGFQMRFLELASRLERTCQFEVAASAIRVCDVQPPRSR